MRTRIVLSVLLVFVVAFFLFIKPSAKENNIQLAPGFDTTFRIGAFDNGWAGNNYSNIIDLGLNLWQKYSDIESGWTVIGVDNDIRESTDGGAYTGNVRSKISQNTSYGFKTMLDRCKLDYLGLGKRSVYECEADTNHYPDRDYWFYGYWTHNPNVSDEYQDNSTFGNGIYTRHSSPSLGHTAGYVVQGLKSNREQLWMREPTLQNLIIYILPRIRIDTNIYINSDTTRVCRIDILKTDSSIAKSVILRANNFTQFYNGIPDYHGEYINMFNNNNNIEPITINSISELNVNNYWIDEQQCKVDYRVYWYGECEMWLDNITVENDIAYNFFHDNPDTARYHRFQQWLDWEVNNIAQQKESEIFNFYFDEPEFSSLPALAKINREIKSRLPGTSIRIVPCIMYYMLKCHIPDYKHYQYSDAQLKKYIFDSLDIAYFNFDNYPFNGAKYYWTQKPMSKIPTTLKDTVYNETNGILAESISPSAYDAWLQYFLDNPDFSSDSTPFYDGLLKKANSLYRQYNIPFIPAIQTHLNDAWDGKLKEPSNEEISLLSNLAISYGAKGLIYAAYVGYGPFPVPLGQSPNYSRGLINGVINNVDMPRLYNVYGQPKWDSIKSLNQKIKKWAPYLTSFDNANTNSYIYRIDKNSLTSNTFIKGLKTYIPAIGVSPSDTSTNNLSYNQQSDTYLQAAVFDVSNPNEFVKYMMLVNRRCSPCKDNTSTDNIGGRRIITINLSGLPSFNNWKLYDLETNTLIKTFDKNSSEINLGNYQPGEGKLYKLVPVMVEGGTLYYDESVTGVTFNCNGLVLSNGKNITIGERTTITFSTNAGFSMQNANFVCSITGDIGTNAITLRPNTNSFWQGVSVEYGSVNMDGVKVYDNNSGQDGIYIIRGSECSSTYLSNCRFYLTGSSRAVSFDAYTNNEDEEDTEYYHDYLLNTEINADGSENPLALYSCTGESGLKIMMDGNRFTCVNNPGGIAVLLILYNGILESNIIDNFSTGVQLSCCNISFSGNSILNSSNGANAINAVANSFAALGMDGNTITGGGNSLNIAGSDAKILEFYNSGFNLGSGNNNFNLTDYDALDIYGYSQYDPDTEEELDATDNCFYYNNSEMYHNTDYANGYGGNQYSFIYGAEQCMTEQRSMDFIVDLDYNLKDTVFKLSNSSENLSTAKQIIKNVNVNFRKAEYENVKQNCELLLSNYIDSIAVNDIISKLYVSVLSLDTNGLLQNLKGTLEQLILQHPSKIGLVNCAFYFIQKCKVVNADYNSALQGFQQVIQQNPYDYIGLVASWDYAATILLRDTIGAGGYSNSYTNLQESNEQQALSEEQIKENMERYLNIFEKEKYDSTKFSKQDRKQIKETLSKHFPIQESNK